MTRRPHRTHAAGTGLHPLIASGIRRAEKALVLAGRAVMRMPDMPDEAMKRLN